MLDTVKTRKKVFVPEDMILLNQDCLMLVNGGNGNCGNCPAKAKQPKMYNIDGATVCKAPEMKDLSGLNPECAVVMLLEQAKEMSRNRLLSFLSYLSPRRKSMGLSNSLQ